MKIVKRVIFVAILMWMLYTISTLATDAKVVIEGARMRKSASTDSEVVTIVYKDENVGILTKENDWYKVKYKEYEGYIRQDLLDVQEDILEEPKDETSNSNIPNENQPEEPENVENQTKEEFKEIEKQVSLDTKARIIPSLSASGIGDLSKGTKVIVIQIINNWSCIKYNNKTAWVPNNCLEDLNSSNVTSDIEQENIIKTGYVAVEEINLREEPSTSSNVLGSLRQK